MAATTAPMASQLKSSFTSTTGDFVTPKGLSGPALKGFPTPRRLTSFTIMAIQSEKYQKLHHSHGHGHHRHQPGYLKEFNLGRKWSPKCRAFQESQTYQGVYGSWSIDPADVREVVLYRTGLVIAAGSFVMGAATPFLPQDASLTQLLQQYLDVLYAFGAAGLGLSLFLIHIYVTPIKRTLQAFWLLGVLGSFATYLTLAQPASQGLVLYVLNHPPSLFLVGPLFAALTGLVFKEGLCYGKAEAALLTLIIPICLLGHLTGILDDGAKLSLLGVWIPLFLIFAARKFTQPIKDDIGDKSVFMFNALSEEEKKALIDKFEQQKS